MDSGSSPTTTTIEEVAAPVVLNLDMKPQMELRQSHQQHQTQKMRKLVRRNASDKLKLIQMVHDNPILWDSRLPNFKGAEEEKTRAWEHIGKEFNAPGRRVARAFKSLRESYRRELAHVKVMGSGFKPKWSLYEAMDFLRDVIRERKGGSHMVDHSAAAGLNLSPFAAHGVALTHNINNNNNNNNNNNGNNHLPVLARGSLNSSLNDSALNLSSRSSLSLNQDSYNYFVKRELDLSSSAGHTPLQPSAAHQNISAHHHDARVSSTRNDTGHNSSNINSTVNNTVNGSNINDNNNFEDLDGGSSSPRSGDEVASMRNPTLSCSDGVEELEAIDADFPYPLILENSTSPTGGLVVGGKRRRKDMDMNDGGADEPDDGDDEGDAYGGQMMQQHRHLRSQNGLDMPPPQTVREVLNSKFCGFISAKLNSMEDTEADNLMNKILMLLVQTQGNALLQEANK